MRKGGHIRALVVFLACVAAAGSASLAGAARRQAPSQTEFIAFRLDAQRVVATLKVLTSHERQVKEGLSEEPIARYGYRHFEIPAAWREQVPADVRDVKRWTVHAAPGIRFDAATETLVGGQPQCSSAVGVLLRIDPAQASAFAAISSRYFVVQATTSTATVVAEPSPIRAIRADDLTPAQRASLKLTLDRLLTRELPRVRQESADEVARMASSSVGYHRSWARDRQAIEAALSRGDARLEYDVQSFVLSPDATPLRFVRAYWLVGARKGFVASVWVKGDQSFEIVESNVRAASWLRMFEFQGDVDREQLGLVLNVFDRNGDGWGEILFALGGYESMGLSLLEYSPTGLKPGGLDYSFGC
jgi:hypothetical protein